ncbi:MAG: response regulator transcription factor [Pirellulales bacterium]
MASAASLRKYRVLLADDHKLVRSGLAALLQQTGRYEIAAEANDGLEAVEKVQSIPCELLIIDLAMARLGGIEAIQRIREHNKRLKILVLSMYDDAQFVARAMKAGANGYLLKHAMDEDLFRAIEVVFDGETFISELIDSEALREFSFEDTELTAREIEVLHLIAAGMTNSEIADALFISPHTVTRHRANVMRKLNVHNRVELVHAANRRGLITLEKLQ